MEEEWQRREEEEEEEEDGVVVETFLRKTLPCLKIAFPTGRKLQTKQQQQYQHQFSFEMQSPIMQQKEL